MPPVLYSSSCFLYRSWFATPIQRGQSECLLIQATLTTEIALQLSTAVNFAFCICTWDWKILNLLARVPGKKFHGYIHNTVLSARQEANYPELTADVYTYYLSFSNKTINRIWVSLAKPALLTAEAYFHRFKFFKLLMQEIKNDNRTGWKISPGSVERVWDPSPEWRKSNKLV